MQWRRVGAGRSHHQGYEGGRIHMHVENKFEALVPEVWHKFGALRRAEHVTPIT